MEEVICRTVDMKWGELREFPGRAEVKVLRDESLSDAKTLLVRIPPGGEINPHSHRGIVQHYVLEGQYHTNGQVFGPGSYRLMPAQYDVSPMTTESGVTILMMYDPVGK
jgi:anti-sigma factor ChrR (cupin superfamily)